jgi:hypothetical protein
MEKEVDVCIDKLWIWKVDLMVSKHGEVRWFKESGEKIGDDLAKSLQSKLGHQNLYHSKIIR